MLAQKSERSRQDIRRSTSTSVNIENETSINEHHRNYLKFNRSDIFKPDKINHREENVFRF
jgi:hypothetical protein